MPGTVMCPVVSGALHNDPVKQVWLLAPCPRQGTVATCAHKWQEGDPNTGLFGFKAHAQNKFLVLTVCHWDSRGDAMMVRSEASRLTCVAQAGLGSRQWPVELWWTQSLQRRGTVFGMDIE